MDLCWLDRGNHDRKEMGWVSGSAAERMVEVSFMQIGEPVAGAGLGGHRGWTLTENILCLWGIQVDRSV